MLARELAGETLDLVFLNAGVTGPRDLRKAEAADIDAAIPAQPHTVAAVVTGNWRPAGWAGPARGRGRPRHA